MVGIKRWTFARRITHEATSLSETTLFTGYSLTPVLAYLLYVHYTLKLVRKVLKRHAVKGARAWYYSLAMTFVGLKSSSQGRGKCRNFACTARLLVAGSTGNSVRQGLVQRSVIQCCLSVSITQFNH